MEIIRALTKLSGVKRLMKERGSPSYDFVIGSDIARDGMYVEVRLKDSNPLLVLAEIFFSDQTHTFALNCYVQNIPLDVILELIDIAKKRLPPTHQ
ncbi:hypothetical protein ACT3RT_11080 [Ewingella sp. AOP9-I1-14]